MSNERKSQQEKEAERVFNAIKTKLIGQLGRSALDSDQVDRAGRELFGAHWHGVYNLGNFKPRKRAGGSYAILNTARTDTSPGYHWLGAYTSPAGVTYLWDSFGRNIKRLAWPLAKKLVGTGHTLVGGDNDAQQTGFSQTCGPQSLAWLMVVRTLGVKAASLV
jgi:hypothetical protein